MESLITAPWNNDPLVHTDPTRLNKKEDLASTSEVVNKTRSLTSFFANSSNNSTNLGRSSWPEGKKNPVKVTEKNVKSQKVLSILNWRKNKKLPSNGLSVKEFDVADRLQGLEFQLKDPSSSISDIKKEYKKICQKNKSISEICNKEFREQLMLAECQKLKKQLKEEASIDISEMGKVFQGLKREEKEIFAGKAEELKTILGQIEIELREKISSIKLILSIPSVKAYYIKAQEAQHQAENIHFYNAVEDYKNESSLKKRKKKALEIKAHFLYKKDKGINSAEEEINIADEIKNPLLDAIQKDSVLSIFTEKLFDEAQNCVVSLMRDNISNFINHEQYKKLTESLGLSS